MKNLLLTFPPTQVHLKSAVVHETHSNRDKLHHVSKVYFYSVRTNSVVNFIQNNMYQVSDILQNSSSTELEDQVNLLRAEANSEEQQQAVTPRINSSVCDEEFFDRVESPFLPILSPREVGSPFQRWPRVHTGTSSLRYDILHHHHDDNDDDQEEGGGRWEPRRKPGGHSFPVALPPHQRQSL